MSSLALELLEEVREISGTHQWLFSITGRVIIKTDNLGVAVANYSKWRLEQVLEKKENTLERWTAKDTRTTATSILIRLRIPKEQRYLLQSREDGSVESKHYDHDDRLSEKREAAEIYTAELVRILGDSVGYTLLH